MPYDINSQQVDIENLFKQNELDLCSIKELYRKLKELEEKITQIKYIDTKLADKLKKDYESLKKVILDENIQTKLTNDINEIDTSINNINNDINVINSQSETITKNKYDDVIISRNELSMKANGVVKKIIQLPTKLSEFQNDIGMGTFDTTTIFNELNTTNKTIIGAINELFALIKNNGSGSANTTASGIKVEPTSVNIKVNGTTDVTMLFGSDVTNKSM